MGRVDVCNREGRTLRRLTGVSSSVGYLTLDPLFFPGPITSVLRLNG